MLFLSCHALGAFTLTGSWVTRGWLSMAPGFWGFSCSRAFPLEPSRHWLLLSEVLCCLAKLTSEPGLPGYRVSEHRAGEKTEIIRNNSLPDPINHKGISYTLVFFVLKNIKFAALPPQWNMQLFHLQRDKSAISQKGIYDFILYFIYFTSWLHKHSSETA